MDYVMDAYQSTIYTTKPFNNFHGENNTGQNKKIQYNKWRKQNWIVLVEGWCTWNTDASTFRII